MKIESLIDEICFFIREKTPNRYGFFRTETFGVKTRKWNTNRCDPDDLGDFAPFMAWFDVATGKRKNLVWIEKQISLMDKAFLQKSGFYYPFSDGRSFAKKSLFFPSYPQNHMDCIMGFGLLYRLTKKSEYLKANKRLCNAVIKYAMSGKGFIRGAVIPLLHVYYPAYGYLRYKPQLSGMFIEELANLYDLTNETKYLNASKKIAHAWISTPSFRRHGLFVDQVYPFLNREATNIASTGKPNTNMIYGLLRLYELSHEKKIEKVCRRSLQGLKKLETSEGTYMTSYNTHTGQIIDRNVNLTQNHMVIGVLLDAYEIFGKREYLMKAQKCANFWIGTQSSNGLFPLKKPCQNGWERCDIDTNADIITMLCRLHMLSPKKEYLNSIKAGVRGYSFFRAKNSFYQIVDSRNGKPLTKTNELKFLGGALKGLMSAFTVLSKNQKNDNETIRLLMRDR